MTDSRSTDSRITDLDLHSALAAALAPLEDEGFSDRVMARIQAEDLLRRIQPAPRSRRWALPALALSAGLVAGTVARSTFDITALPVPTVGSMTLASTWIYAAAGLLALTLWLVADPDALA